MKKLISLFLITFAAQNSFSVNPETSTRQIGDGQPFYVVAGLENLRATHIVAEQISIEDGIGIAQITEFQGELLSHYAHEIGGCGGYLRIPNEKMEKRDVRDLLVELKENFKKATETKVTGPKVTGEEQSDITSAVALVKPNNIESWVNWLQQFGTRFHKSATPNKHVDALQTRIQELIKELDFPVLVEQVKHSSTKQNSLVVRVVGKLQPENVVVLGGHLDSINHSYFEDKTLAPGADDNASGSAALLEALRVVLMRGQPNKSIEFYFYAAEEVGLWGSAEIAKAAKKISKSVQAVLQLDMVLYPADGVGTIASMTDFTNPDLRAWLVKANTMYGINANILDDKCGYGCSDHASWHSAGYPALMPFEARMANSNPKIHTKSDVVDANSSFEHAAYFAKIAVAFAMELSR
jgi:leucyl aminopeptidase